MLLSDAEIKAALKAGELGLDPFEQDCLEAASYDARLGGRALVGGTDHEIDVSREGSVTIKPGEFVLLLTMEKFKLSDSIAGHLGVKSYYTRKGLVVLVGLQIDPGFEGHLVIGGYNAAPRRLTLDHGAPLVTVEFHKLSRPVQTPYRSGAEQIEGQIPRVDKDYLRTLETKSLTDVSEELRKLAANVGSMQTQLKNFYAPLLVGILLAVVGFGLAALLA